MISISITGAEQLQRDLRDFSERRLKAAIATAMTRTAVQVRDRLRVEMRASIDRPTPYTERQLRFAPASAARPVAAVGFDIERIQDVFGNTVRFEAVRAGTTPAGRYMSVQAMGGARRLKRFEKALQAAGVLPAGWMAVPGSRAKVDAYGNQAPSEIRQILSWFDAAERGAGSTQNMGAAGRQRRRTGTRRTAGFEYFAIVPGARRGGLVPGVYRRTMFALGRRVEPVLIFIRSASYSRRFDFYGIAEREIDRRLPVELTKAIEQSAARLRAASGA